MNIYQTIYIVGVIQGLYLVAMLLFHNRGNQVANRWLAGFVGSFTLTALAGWVFESGVYERYPWMFTSLTGVLFLMGPMLYFYTCTLIGQQAFKPRGWLHFLPFVLYTTYIVYINFLFSDAEIVANLKYWNKEHTDEPFVGTIPWMLIFKTFHVLIYTGVVLAMLRKFTQKLKNNLAALDKINLEWLKILLYVYSGWVLFVLGIMFLVHVGGYYQLFNHSDSVATVGLIVIIFLIGFMGMRQPEIISGELINEQSKKLKTSDKLQNSKSKYQKTALSAIQTKTLYEKLQRQVETEKLYLDSDITLGKLAEKVGLPPHQLSQVINEQSHSNFYDFINNYRVQEAQRLLQDKNNEQYTILYIAYQAGFKNKNSFNRAFKKMTQLTPSTYRTMKQNENIPKK
ncbi:AraC family transcriptional regulator [uncultured Microscilla sp.]|uniref:helix-turn-helix domain-containing protein n=1 Tax=uncultured Microscilla sp. TaxID=432653 RepID=UPI00261FBD2F|nr:AraC family transcriptional regulator [uncultured Microscilla sp.]